MRRNYVEEREKENRTLDIIILMMQMISLIANLWLLKHAIDRSIVKKKTAGERH